MRFYSRPNYLQARLYELQADIDTAAAAAHALEVTVRQRSNAEPCHQTIRTLVARMDKLLLTIAENDELWHYDNAQAIETIKNPPTIVTNLRPGGA